MSTTYILHGGETSRESIHNDEFFATFTNTTEKDHVRILMNYWARPDNDWQSLLKRDSAKVLRQTKKRVSFTIAKDPRHLKKKLPEHDVLYVAGGDAELIEPHIPKLKFLARQLNDKVYIGSSMGVFIVCKQYVLSFENQDELVAHQGLNILPLSCLCHWDAEKKKHFKIQLLQEVDAKIPILTLDECKYVQLIQ